MSADQRAEVAPEQEEPPIVQVNPERLSYEVACSRCGVIAVHLTSKEAWELHAEHRRTCHAE